MSSLILLRGLPGAGKTELARVLSENNKWPVLSVDDYFTDPVTGAYEFKFAENHIAYKQCLEKTEMAMRHASEKLIVHNTFTLAWEIEPYFLLAGTYQYKTFVVTVENYHNNKNNHGISEEQILKMADKYKVKLM